MYRQQNNTIDLPGPVVLSCSVWPSSTAMMVMFFGKKGSSFLKRANLLYRGQMGKLQFHPEG
uniref:Uncharacterized protein n=1 Tax=Romanomermis culicivorax TaxID=13658 RepID=A0A915HFN0_ROMCU